MLENIIVLFLDRQVKYGEEIYPVGEPVPVKEEDLSYFKEKGMIIKTKGESGVFDVSDSEEKDKLIQELKTDKKNMKENIKELKAENEELKAQLEAEKKEQLLDEELESKNVDELYDILQELEIEGRTKLRQEGKEAMIQAILNQEDINRKDAQPNEGE